MNRSITLILPFGVLGLAVLFAVDRAVTPIEMERLGNGDAVVELSGLPGKHYRIEVSEDLQQWDSVAVLQGLGPLKHTVSGRAGGARFFRAAEVAGAAGMTGEVIAHTDSGDVVLRPIEHASFVIHWNGITVYNDPVGSESDYRRLPSPDLILVSHQHGDHFSSSTLNSLVEDETVIVTPASVFNQLSSTLKEKATTLANGESVELLGLTVEAVPAYNDRHPKGRDNGYVLTLGGQRLYMSGDTEDVPEMRALEGIDVAFLAMNLPFTMSVEQAASALLDFRPGIVYPYHYRNSGGTFADLDLLKELLKEAPVIEVREGEWY